MGFCIIFGGIYLHFRLFFEVKEPQYQSSSDLFLISPILSGALGPTLIQSQECRYGRLIKGTLHRVVYHSKQRLYLLLFSSADILAIVFNFSLSGFSPSIMMTCPLQFTSLIVNYILSLWKGTTHLLTLHKYDFNLCMSILSFVVTSNTSHQ